MFVADKSAREMITQSYLDGMRDERKRLEAEGVCFQGDMYATIAQNMEKLQEQIEKMKHCVNCRYALRNIPICITCTRGGAYYDGKKTDNWKLEE